MQAGQRFLRFLPLCPHPRTGDKETPPSRPEAAAAASALDKGHRHARHTRTIARETPITGNGRDDSGTFRDESMGPMPNAPPRGERLSTGFWPPSFELQVRPREERSNLDLRTVPASEFDVLVGLAIADIARWMSVIQMSRIAPSMRRTATVSSPSTRLATNRCAASLGLSDDCTNRSPCVPRNPLEAQTDIAARGPNSKAEHTVRTDEVANFLAALHSKILAGGQQPDQTIAVDRLGDVPPCRARILHSRYASGSIAPTNGGQR